MRTVSMDSTATTTATTTAIATNSAISPSSASPSGFIRSHSSPSLFCIAGTVTTTLQAGDNSSVSSCTNSSNSNSNFNSVMFNVKILILCFAISYLNEYSYQSSYQHQHSYYQYPCCESSVSSNLSSILIMQEQQQPEHNCISDPSAAPVVPLAAYKDTVKKHSIFYPYIINTNDAFLDATSSSISSSSVSESLLLPLQTRFQSFYNNTLLHQHYCLHHPQHTEQGHSYELHDYVMMHSLPLHYDIAESTEYNYKSMHNHDRCMSRSMMSSSILSSSNFNSSSSSLSFYGRYPHIRATLDYNYHCNYIPSRQLVQDEIIRYILQKSQSCRPTKSTSSSKTTVPWIVFTAGAMGAGKSYTIKHLNSKNRFPLDNFITIDPDEIRNLLPEYQYYIHQYNQQPQNSSTTNTNTSTSTSAVQYSSMMEYAGEYTRKESGYICEILVQIALQNGCNVLMDGSLRDYKWYMEHFKSLRAQYQYNDGGSNGSNTNGNTSNGIKIGIIHVQAPKDAILERARLRSKITRRIVPSHVLEESIVMVPKSVKILSQHVDFFVELYNGPDVNKDIEIITEGVTWDTFKNAFYDNNYCATTCANTSSTLSTTTRIPDEPSEQQHQQLKATKKTKSKNHIKLVANANTSTKTPISKKSFFLQGGMKVDEEMDYQLLRLLSKL